jgi:cytoskeletal protein RodZ
MSTFRNPVGPQSSRVYWRRRLVVGLGLLAVLVVIVLIVSRLVASGEPTPASSDTPAPSGSASGSPTPLSTNPADAEACDPSKVELTAVTDSTSYEAGVMPVMSFALKNNTSVACTFDAGSDLQEFIITSGDERIWSSKDCQTDPVAATVPLQPRVPFAGSSLPWDRTRSATDTCGIERPQVTAEGASYHLQVKIGDLTSVNSVQFLLY